MVKSGLLKGGAVALALALSLPAAAQIAVSGNDNKRRLEDGVARVVRDPPPDSATIIDLSGATPRVVGEVQLSTSAVGPPLSVAVTPDEHYAFVTSNERIDPADPTKTVPDNRVQVVDLRATPPRVTQTVEAGAGAAGVSVNRAGNLVMVANRNAGTVSVFRFASGMLTPLSTVTIGDAAASPSHVQFTPDGRRALVSRDNTAASFVTVLNVDGETVTKTNRDITAGIRPYGLAVTPDGRWGVVANIGRGAGDADTVTLINLQREPFFAVDTATVGPNPEGIQVSPDNRHVAVTVHNGSTRRQGDPLRGHTQLVVLRIDGGRLSVVASAPAGDWAQGVAFSRDGKTILVQNMVDRNIAVFRFEQDQLRDTGQRIAVSGGPAGIRTAEGPPSQ